MIDTVAIIMCAWQRPERLKITLDLLCNQTNMNFMFYIWNNNKNIGEFINSTTNLYQNKLLIQVVHSDVNIGGFGRFLLAEMLIEKHDKVIFIDDDQIFNNNMVDKFLENYDENAIKSRWAWKFNSASYSDRVQINEGDVNIHYCGTGGMILPIKVFKCEELYRIPQEFLFVEDLWLSFIGNHYLSMKLISIKNDFIAQEADNKDQSTLSFLTIKNKLLEYLIINKKWQILTT